MDLDRTEQHSSSLPRGRDQDPVSGGCARVETLAERHPRRYAALALSLGLSGYLAILAFPLITLVCLGAGAWLLATPAGQAAWPWVAVCGIGAALSGWASYRLMSLKLPMPNGWEPSADSDLKALADAIALELGIGTPPRLQVIESHYLNVIRLPNRALPTGFEAVLQIGAQVLLTTSPAHLRVLVAGRMGQLRYGLGHSDGWISLLAQVWPGLASALSDEDTWAGRLLHRWVDAYARSFGRWAVPAIRRHELYADHAALELIDHEAVMAAIIQDQLAGHVIDTIYLPSFFALAKRYPNPPYSPYSRMFRIVIEQGAPGPAAGHLAHLMSRQPEGIHPSLRERLRAIGHHKAEPPAPFADIAARSLLSAGELKGLLQALESRWLEAHTPAWQERHRLSRRRLVNGLRLQKRANAGKLSEQESWDLALLVQRKIHDKSKASKLYRRVLGSNPRDPRIWFFVGQRLLEAGDKRGAAALQRAAEMDARMSHSASQLIKGHLVGSVHDPEADPHSARAATPAGG